MAGTLDGQVALVTGASRGIGKAIALELARHGAPVAVNYVRSKELAEQVVAEIQKGGGKAQAFGADVSQAEQVDAMVDQVVAALGPIRILVNNAGTTADRTLRRMSLEEWHKVMDTNLNGVFYVTRKVWPIMGDAGGGHVVCISSVVGETGRIGLINYGTSKSALLGFVRAAAWEGARFKIQVNAVAPGFIQTDMIANISDAVRAEIISRTPLGRFGAPEEIAKVVRFLVTEGTYITGATLDVNGGLYM